MENTETIVYEQPIKEKEEKKVNNPKPNSLKLYESLEADYSQVEGFMNKKEFTRIERNNDIRDMLIESLLTDGEIPTDTRKIRLIKEILADQDSSINSMIGTKLKHKEINSDGKFKEAALELLYNMQNYNKQIERTEELDFKTDLKDTITLVDGQLKTGVVQLDPNEFIKEK